MVVNTWLPYLILLFFEFGKVLSKQFRRIHNLKTKMAFVLKKYNKIVLTQMKCCRLQIILMCKINSLNRQEMFFFQEILQK